MVTNQATICDQCKKKIADKKCCWCEKDLCAYCRRASFDVILRSVDIHQLITEVVFCKECKKKLKAKFGSNLDGVFDSDIGDKIQATVQKHLSSKMIAESL